MKHTEKTKRITQRDFKILLSFLTDRDPGTLTIVKDQIRLALRQHPRYKGLLETDMDPTVKQLAQQFFEELRFEDMVPDFQDLFRRGENLDLERGVYLLARMEYPKLKLADVSSVLDQMAKEIDQVMVKEKPMPTKGVHGMRKYLFEMKNFRGNEENYYSPDNIYINRVLKTKVGMPITLSCIYLFLAWRLGFTAHGVGLPGHFIVGHRIPRGVTHIDPFNGGRILRSKDCEVLVRRLGMQFKQEYLDPMENLQILTRMIVNLINVYTDAGQTYRAQMLAQLFQLVEP